MKIQFCQSMSLLKTLVSMVSGPAKRDFASSPDRASGLKLVRSSSAMRTSLSQSRSSGAKVIRPSRSASSAWSGLPACFSTAARPLPSPR